MQNEKIRILVIESDEEYSQALQKTLNTDKTMVCEIAPRVSGALDALVKSKPDFIIYRIVHGIHEINKDLHSITQRYPTPVILVSPNESDSALLHQIEFNCAVDCLQGIQSPTDIEPSRQALLDKIMNIEENYEIKNSFMRRKLQLLINHREEMSKNKTSAKKHSAVAEYFDLVSGRRRPQGTDVHIIAIAISTGGPPALYEIITKLPDAIPVPIVIVQHIPPEFSLSLAKRLEGGSMIKVKHAEEGDRLHPGVVYIAPGGYNLSISKKFTVELSAEESTEIYKPSANVLFNSVAEVYGKKTVAIIMTGMGNDGTNGAMAIRNAGGYVAVQSPETCIVSGMVQSALKNKLADIVLNENEIASFIAGIFGLKIEAKQPTVS